MLDIFSSPPFYSKYVKLPDDSVPPKIRQNPKFWPFFKDAIGAIDGSHIHVSPPAFQCSAYHNCKGLISQNCLFACDFDMNFTYALTGWEGSATDARVYEDAVLMTFNSQQASIYLRMRDSLYVLAYLSHTAVCAITLLNGGAQTSGECSIFRLQLVLY